ncbi:hypothetical protein J6590_087951 [Homalodisca vitripennis]|nr:hypothetical protein J6590_087951 [Homalodisca vitripennis]
MKDHVPFEHLPVIPSFECPFRLPALLRSHLNHLMKAAQSRSDDTEKTIVARIGFEHDVVAAEAKYHNDCFVSFLKPTTGG